MNIDPVELFGAELVTPKAKGQVIAQLQLLSVSAAIKRTTYARWCELADVPKDDIDFRAVTRKVI